MGFYYKMEKPENRGVWGGFGTIVTRRGLFWKEQICSSGGK